MKLATVASIASDLRLNPDAARVVFFVAGLGKGKHPIPFTQISRILSHAGEKRVRAAVALAVSVGWLSRSKGGWGKPDSFEFTDPAPEAATTEALDPAAQGVTVGALSPPQEQPQESPETDSAPDPAQSAATEARIPLDPAAGAGSVVVVVEEDVVGRDPPVVPPEVHHKHEIDGRVIGELEEETWAGCRGAVRDYFGARVTTDRQWGYLMTLKTWMDGSPVSPSGFGKLPPDEQRAVLSSGLNEFLSESVMQEKEYRSSRGQTGQIRALHTKVEYAIRHREQGRTRGKRASTGNSAQASLFQGEPDPEAPHGRDHFGRPNVPFPEEAEN